MTHRIAAIYEDGVLRPLSPLNLPEHSQVEIDIHHLGSPVGRTHHRDQVHQAMVDARLSVPVSDPTVHSVTPISAERREELARLFSTGGPVSDLISEDREGR